VFQHPAVLNHHFVTDEVRQARWRALDYRKCLHRPFSLCQAMLDRSQGFYSVERNDVKLQLSVAHFSANCSSTTRLPRHFFANVADVLTLSFDHVHFIGAASVFLSFVLWPAEYCAAMSEGRPPTRRCV